MWRLDGFICSERLLWRVRKCEIREEVSRCRLALVLLNTYDERSLTVPPPLFRRRLSPSSSAVFRLPFRQVNDKLLAPPQCMYRKAHVSDHWPCWLSLEMEESEM